MIRTCLWFDGEAEAAAQLYCDLIPDSRIESVHRPGENSPPILVLFNLAGAPFSALNGGPGYPPTIAASVVVETADQAETDRVWQAFLDAGSREVQCGWMTDRFGVSWQIVPKGLKDALFSADPAAAARAYAALRTMKKLDLAALVAARDGH